MLVLFYKVIGDDVDVTVVLDRGRTSSCSSDTGISSFMTRYITIFGIDGNIVLSAGKIC